MLRSAATPYCGAQAMGREHNPCFPAPLVEIVTPGARLRPPPPAHHDRADADRAGQRSRFRHGDQRERSRIARAAAEEALTNDDPVVADREGSLEVPLSGLRANQAVQPDRLRAVPEE